jgi:pyruvate formate lyase activating enzyme
MEAVCVSGGEPLIHEDLEMFLRIIKDRKLLVKLDTNGSFPEKLQNLISKELVDHVALDVKAPLEKYGQVTASNVDVSLITRSVELIKSSGLEYTFRTTIVPGLIDVEDLEEICRIIEGASVFQIQQFVPHNTIDRACLDLKPLSREKLDEMVKVARLYFNEVLVDGL